MRNWIIIGVSAFLLGILFYFTREFWIESIVPSQEVLVETGVVNTDLVDVVTGSIEEMGEVAYDYWDPNEDSDEGVVDDGATEIIYEKTKDLGLFVTEDGHPFGPNGGDWKKNFSYYCMFPGTDDILPKDRDDFAPIEPLLPKEIYGKVKCSNGQILSYNGKITGKAYSNLEYKDGLYDIYIQKDGGVPIGPFPHPYNCIVEICPLIIYGTDDYLVRLDAGGDSYDSWMSFDYYNLANGENLFGTISAGNPGLAGSTNYLSVERDKNILELLYISSSEGYTNDDGNSDCWIVTTTGFVIQKNKQSLRTFDLPVPKISRGCIEEKRIGEFPIPMDYTFEPDSKTLSIEIPGLFDTITIDLTALNIK